MPDVQIDPVSDYNVFGCIYLKNHGRQYRKKLRIWLNVVDFFIPVGKLLNAQFSFVNRLSLFLPSRCE
jgi:hypothetical protein